MIYLSLLLFFAFNIVGQANEIDSFANQFDNFEFSEDFEDYEQVDEEENENYALNTDCNDEKNEGFSTNYDFDDDYVEEIDEGYWVDDNFYQDRPDRDQNCLSKKCKQTRIGYIDIKPGYFYPTSSRLRQIYETGGFNGQLELGFFPINWLAIWMQGGAYWRDGLAVNSDVETHIIIATGTLGLKGVYEFNRYISAYLGAGARYFYLHIRNNSDFVQRKVIKNKIGGGFTAGFWIFPKPGYPLFFDVFVDYGTRKVDFSGVNRNNLKLDGTTAGIGLGCQF
ncbi:MAG: hypothetical protein PVI40_06450 [Chlamydiota bacterium]|jgi:hypothetical protein